jgi:hypothetical protein
MMLGTDVLAAAPVTFTVLVMCLALVALRAVTRTTDLSLSTSWSRALDSTIVVLMVLFGGLVIARFLTLA